MLAREPGTLAEADESVPPLARKHCVPPRGMAYNANDSIALNSALTPRDSSAVQRRAAPRCRLALTQRGVLLLIASPRRVRLPRRSLCR